jgi:hypothetical protein
MPQQPGNVGARIPGMEHGQIAFQATDGFDAKHVLARPMLIDRGFADPGHLRDFVDAGALDTAIGHQFQSGA